MVARGDMCELCRLCLCGAGCGGQSAHWNGSRLAQCLTLVTAFVFYASTVVIIHIIHSMSCKCARYMYKVHQGCISYLCLPPPGLLNMPGMFVYISVM